MTPKLNNELGHQNYCEVNNNMQMDFHYYGIYTLCCLANIHHDFSEKIAYASQHTDDAKYNHELFFKNGGRFKQQRSAHEFLDLKVFTKEVGYDIFLPFHFLPGAEGEEFYESLICRENSEVAQEMLGDTLSTLEKPYGLHRLGITLHIYADTWAHQNFHGLQKQHNVVNNLSYKNKSALLRSVAEYLPEIGHGQAFKSPDEPYLVWSYRGYNMKEEIEINNTERYVDAAAKIFNYIAMSVYEKYPEIFVEEPRKWVDVENLFREIFAFNGELEDRINNWKDKLSSNFFGFKSFTSYHDREWFRKAVVVYKNGIEDEYHREPDFNKSDWKYFHDAVTYHSFYIKHELLPKYGIIT